MKHSYLIGLLVVALSITANAQDDDNLVPNAYFEEVEGKIRRGGGIVLASGWFSPTQYQADLYDEGNKKPEINIPENTRGKQKPQEGKHYAGITAFSYKNAKPRTYITAQFLTPLAKGVKYCVSYHVSLSDLSKYAVNRVGAHISKKEPKLGETKQLLLETSITHPKNQIIDETAMWFKVCDVYVAQGGEKFITIGNFSKDTETEYKKVKKPKGFVAPQTPDAYYFVEGISVTAVEPGEDASCNCLPVTQEDVMVTIFSKSSSGNWDDLSTEEKVASSTIYYANNRFHVDQKMKSELDRLAKLLMENPEINLEVIGHSDNEEVKKEEKSGFGLELAQKRAKEVVRVLTAHGVAADRLKVVTKDNKEPADLATHARALSKNRRVEFKMVQ